MTTALLSYTTSRDVTLPGSKPQAYDSVLPRSRAGGMNGTTNNTYRCHTQIEMIWIK